MKWLGDCSFLEIFGFLGEYYAFLGKRGCFLGEWVKSLNTYLSVDWLKSGELKRGKMESGFKV